MRSQMRHSAPLREPFRTALLNKGGSNTWSTLTDGTTTLRKYIEDGYLYVDKTLTPTGFAGAENTDWVNVRSVDIFP